MNNLIIIIMARTGSKRIKMKNFKPLNGIELFKYTLKSAVNSHITEDIIISTDHPDISCYFPIESDKIGAFNIHARPKETADDKTTVQQALINVIKELNLQDNYKNVMMLMPTNPFRGPKLINTIWYYYAGTKSKTLVTANRNIQNVEWDVSKVKTNDFKDSKELKERYCLNGAIWLSDIETLLNKKTFYHNETKIMYTDFIQGFDIDTIEDWNIAEIIARGLK